MKEDLKYKSSIGVIGAGIQGVCISLSLIKKGFKVTLLDRDEPAKQSASYGNAGHFSPYASVPMNRPDILVDVPSMLLSSTGPLSLRWSYVPKMIPWFLKFVKNCSKKNMMHTAKYMHQILDLALPAYDELFQEIDVSGLVESKGIIYFWTKKDLKSRELEINIRKELGVKQQLLTPHEIHDLEPHIKKIYHGGVLYPSARHAKNPGKILLKLYDLFLKKGGYFKRENVETINFSSDNKPIIKTNLNSYTFAKAVVACGAFSKKLTDQLDEKIFNIGDIAGKMKEKVERVEETEVIMERVTELVTTAQRECVEFTKENDMTLDQKIDNLYDKELCFEGYFGKIKDGGKKN